jgi:mannosyltransferase
MLRVWDLPARSLWLDEATEYWDAASFDITNVQAMSARHDPPLFSVLMRGWMVLGRDEFTLRYPSVAFSLLSVAGVILLVRRLFGLGPALVSGLSLALLPTDIRYAQEFGQYAALVCLVIWSLVGLDLIARGRAWQGCILWVAAAIIGAYMHYLDFCTLGVF